jgi:hypothetical protein
MKRKRIKWVTMRTWTIGSCHIKIRNLGMQRLSLQKMLTLHITSANEQELQEKIFITSSWQNIPN